MRSIQLSILIVCLINLVSCQSQTNCAFTEKGIPQNKKYYMIGETHLDNVQERKTSSELEFINRVLACEDTIRKFLTDSCNVNNYVIEGQVWLEYFFNKYLQTGKEEWIDILNNNEYQQGKIRSIRKIAETNKNVKITCIDYDYKKYYRGVIKLLFSVCFYEKYTNLFIADAKLNKISAAYDNTPLAKAMLHSNPNHSAEVQSFLQFLINAYETNPKSTPDSLLIICEKYLNNDAFQLELDRYVGNYSFYFTRLITSYFYGYKMNTDSMNDLKRREEMMFANLGVIEYLYPNDIFCLQMGAHHLMPEKSFDVIRYKIATQKKSDPYCFFIIPLGKEKFYMDHFQGINFDFKGVACFFNQSINESVYLVK